MNIPVDDNFMKRYVESVQVEEGKRELAHRLQQDYAVFISYSHADKDIVKRLLELFDQRTIRYVYDEKTLVLGDNISDEVRRHIERCTHYLLILSDNSVGSQWVAYEFGIAAGLKKECHIYLTSKDVAVPPFASNILATADPLELEDFFSRQLIDSAAVNRLLAEILHDPRARLETLQRWTKVDGQEGWEAPDREAIEDPKPTAADYFDDYPGPGVNRLIRIELEDTPSAKHLVLHYWSSKSQPGKYRLSYNRALGAVVVTEQQNVLANPQKDGSNPVGICDQTGNLRLYDRSSIVDKLHGTTLYGWRTSQDFWEQALRRLRDQLPVKSAA